MTDRERPVAGPRFVVAVLGAGAVAALTVPDGPPGLGIVLSCLCLAVAVALAEPAPRTSPTLGFGVLALLLAAIAVVRDASWLVALDLLAALAVGSLAVAGGRGPAAVARGLAAVLAHAPRAPGFLANSTGRAVGSARLGHAVPAVRALAIGSVLVAVFGALFASADEAFARLAPDLTPAWSPEMAVARTAVFALAACLAGALALGGPRFAPRPDAAWSGPLPRADLRAVSEADVGQRRLTPFEWALPLLLLNGLFAVFVAVQATTFSGGAARVIQTAGLTYAEYAREGFGQLVVAAALTLGVVAAAPRLSHRPLPRHETLLKALLGGLCLLTLAILASALHRLGLYEAAFGFTRARVAGYAFALWLGALFLLILAAGALGRGAALPRAAVALTAASLVLFSLANPDGMAASGNVERYERTGKIDEEYLSGLSADAVPALATLPPSASRCALAGIASGLTRPGPWSSANLARTRARGALGAAGWEAVGARGEGRGRFRPAGREAGGSGSRRASCLDRGI